MKNILKSKEKHFESKYQELAEELRNGKGYADPDEVRSVYNCRHLGKHFDTRDTPVRPRQKPIKKGVMGGVPQ